VWDRLHRALLDRLGEDNQIDWSRAVLDQVIVSGFSPICVKTACRFLT
jgi:hypothetical protein